MRFTIPWGIPLSHLFPWEIPTTRKNFPYGKFPAFFTNPLWEIPTRKTFPYGKFPLLFTIPPPMGNSPKKIWKKIFLRDIWTTVPPKMGVPPEERGHGGIPTPPIYPIGGGNYLFGYLFGCYLFSVLLILFILAVSDAMLSFIFVTFLLWRYLL